MWGAEGAERNYGAVGSGVSRNGVDLRGFCHLLTAHIRQNSGKPLCQHTLARAGRTNKEDIVTACGGDLKSSFNVFLRLHVGKIGDGKGVVGNFGAFGG